MADQPLLVLTRLDDPTSDIVITELGRRGVPVMRVDPGDFMTGGVDLAARDGPGGVSGTLRTPSREIRLDQVRSVYVRRPSDYAIPEGLDDHSLARRVMSLYTAARFMSLVLICTTGRRP